MCRNCKGPLVTNKPPPKIPEEQEIHQTPYESVNDVGININDVAVFPGEPIFLNPNSFESVAQVLRAVGKNGGIKQYGDGDREWMFVECDGQPYTVMRDLMDNVWQCSECGNSYYGEETFKQHICHLLRKSEGRREFSWVVPIPGLLHLEMNSARSFIRLNWEIFMSDLARVLGFESDRPQEYCKKGSDHHKT